MIEESAKYAYISIIGMDNSFLNSHKFEILTLSIDHNLCTLKASSIAIASVLLMTENRGYLNFRGSWFDFV